MTLVCKEAAISIHRLYEKCAEEKENSCIIKFTNLIRQSLVRILHGKYRNQCANMSSKYIHWNLKSHPKWGWWWHTALMASPTSYPGARSSMHFHCVLGTFLELSGWFLIIRRGVGEQDFYPSQAHTEWEFYVTHHPKEISPRTELEWF